MKALLKKKTLFRDFSAVELDELLMFRSHR
jgi:hypothetical protein